MCGRHEAHIVSLIYILFNYETVIELNINNVNHQLFSDIFFTGSKPPILTGEITKLN